MTRKIFRSVFAAAVAVLLIAAALLIGVLYGYTTNVSRSQLKVQTTLAAEGVEREGIGYLENLTGKTDRITWIRSDGTVLFDTEEPDPSKMENHLNREEVKQALQNGYGESSRYSATLMEQSLYAATRLSDGSVLRLSVSQYSIMTLLLGLMQPFIIIIVLAVILSAFLAVRLAERVVKPLNKVDLDHPLENEDYDELAPLLHRIAAQQNELQLQQAEIGKRRSQLDSILESMKEGMILLGGDGNIVMMNTAAKKILNVGDGSIGQDILMVNRNLKLQEIIERALDGDREEADADIRGRKYQISASPILYAGQQMGAAVVLFDITEKEKAEQFRREFTGNVSHELKTPLQSISGYAELLKSGLVRSEDIQPFSEKIYKEAQRMIRLVQDIISLSHLDEGAEDLKPERTDLLAVAETAVNELKSAAEKAEVTISAAGEPAFVDGVPALLRNIVYNLCENAVKYNRPGGSVKAEVRNEVSAVILTVTDTGIGIPKEEQSRIFERFYRVDKSRSRAVGGTGLGLSIVKHAAQVSRARIAVESEPGQGTTFTVMFPKAEDEVPPTADAE